MAETPPLFQEYVSEQTYAERQRRRCAPLRTILPSELADLIATFAAHEVPVVAPTPELRAALEWRRCGIAASGCQLSHSLWFGAITPHVHGWRWVGHLIVRGAGYDMCLWMEHEDGELHPELQPRGYRSRCHADLVGLLCEVFNFCARHVVTGGLYRLLATPASIVDAVRQRSVADHERCRRRLSGNSLRGVR